MCRITIAEKRNRHAAHNSTDSDISPAGFFPRYFGNAALFPKHLETKEVTGGRGGRGECVCACAFRPQGGGRTASRNR